MQFFRKSANMLICLSIKMFYILVLCPVLLSAAVQTLTIDSQLGTSIEDCFERISIGEQLPNDAIYRNVSELTTRECELLCKQDKQCQTYDYGVGAKGNATCNLSNLDEKEIKENSLLRRHPDYDVYVRRFQCEQSPPTPLQPQFDDPGDGPSHRPVFRPDEDEPKRPLADEFPPASDTRPDLLRPIPPYRPANNHIDQERPDDYDNLKPDYDRPPSYGAHKPQDIPYKPEKPYNKPSSDVLQFLDPYGKPQRPQDHGSWRPDPQYPGSTADDIPDIYGNKPVRPSRPNDFPAPYRPEEKPQYHYIIRPNRKPYQIPRPEDVGYGSKPKPGQDYPSRPDPYGSNDPGHPGGPVGPPDRPYKPNRPHYDYQYPSRPYDRPIYSYNGQYASNYGQSSNSQDNSIYLEIYDPPRPYKPYKPLNYRPNYDSIKGGYGQNYGYGSYGSYGYGSSYSSQNSYSHLQSGHTQLYGTGTIDEGGDSYNRPHDTIGQRPHKPGYGGSQFDDYGSLSGEYGSQKPQDTYHKPGHSSSHGTYGINQASYSTSSHSDYSNSQASNSQSYGSSNRPSYGSSSHNDYNNQGYGSNSQGSYGSHRPPYAGNRPYGDNKPPYDDDKPSYGGDRPAYDDKPGYGNDRPSYDDNKPNRPGDRPPYNSNRPPFVDKPAYGVNKPGYGDEKPEYEKPGYGGDHLSYDNRPPHGDNKPGYGNNRPQYDDIPGYGIYKPGYGDDRPYGGNRPSYDINRPYGDNRPPYDDNRPSYGEKPGYGENKPGYSSNRPPYDDNRPSYGEKPGYDDNKPGYGSNKPGYGVTRPPYDDSRPSYGEKPGYDDNKPGYGSNKPGYGDTPPSYDNNRPSYGDKPGYGDDKPGYGSNKPGYDDNRPPYTNNRPSYGEKPGYEDSKPGYGSNKPGYNDNRPYGDKPPYGDNRPSYISSQYGSTQSSYGSQSSYETSSNYGSYGETDDYKNNQKPGYGKPKPDNQTDYPGYPDRPDVKPVYEYDIDKPGDVPSYIVRPDGQVVTSRPMTISDYGERPGYSREPEQPVSYKACFRRVLAGRRTLRSHVRRVVPCERLEDCRRECATEKRFHCESFNYRLDPSFRGKGLCELMTKPIEAFDLKRDFVEDKDYDFYELDRNSLEPNCPESLRGPGLLHSGFLSSKPAGWSPGYQDRWSDRLDWHGSTSNRNYDKYYEERKGIRNYGSRRYEDQFFVPYQIGVGRSNEEYDESYGQYGGSYGGYDTYYKDRNDYHKSVNHWRLNEVERPPQYYGVRPYGYDSNFNYHSLGKKLGLWENYGHGYGSWKRGRWNVSGSSWNALDYGESNYYKPKPHYYYEPVDRSDEPRIKDCSSRRRPGMSLGSGAIRRSLLARNVVECEAACFNEREFKCVSYSYRYSNSRGTDNCFLSERPYRGLELSADSGSDVYAMPQDRGCSSISYKPLVESECFWHVRSDAAVDGSAVRAALTVAGLGACEAECIRAHSFFCRGFSFRFDSPTIGDDIENCLLTSSPPTSLERGRGLRPVIGHELYARGNYGRGCEPALYDDIHHRETECYLQYDSAARLIGDSIRGQARVKDERACGSACTDAPFRCLSFSFNNNAPPSIDNCLLSEIRLFDLQRGVDYEHSTDDWLFAFDLFNGQCWRKVHGRGEYDQPTPELPRPLTPPIIEDPYSDSGPGGSGYLPTSPEISCNQCPSSVPSGPSYQPGYSIPEPGYRPGYIPGPGFKPGHPEPSGPGFKPAYPEPSGPGFKPAYPEPSGPVYKPGYIPGREPGYPGLRPEPSGPGYRPGHEPGYRPGYVPGTGYPPSEPSGPDSRPGYSPSNPNRPGYKPGYAPEPSGPGYKPGYVPEPSGPGYKPGYVPEPSGLGYKPGYVPEPSGPVYKPGYRPEPNKPGYTEPSSPGYRPGRPDYPGDRDDNEPISVSWRHYTVSGFPCRRGSACAQNQVAGHWACEPEGGEIGSWDYCCAPTHRCGYSEGFHKPWCYVGPSEDQWRPCSEKYYPYHQHNVPHPSQGHRENRPYPGRPWHNRPPSSLDDRDRPPPRPYISEEDRRYWDELYKNGPQAYYDKYGNPLPGYARVPTANRPYIKYSHNYPRPGSGHWVPVAEDPGALDPYVPGGLGAPRYWPVAYLHKGPPPNMTYFRFNETNPTTSTTERYDPPPPTPLSREIPIPDFNGLNPDGPSNNNNIGDNKKHRDEKTRNITNANEDSYKSEPEKPQTTTTAKPEMKNPINTDDLKEKKVKEDIKPDVEKIKPANVKIDKEIENLKGIDGKLDDFSSSIEVLDIEDAKRGEKASDLKTLEAEERQIEAIGRLLASRRGGKLVLEKRSQKDLEAKSIAIDKDLVEFNFGNRFPTNERRGIVQRVSKDEIESERNQNDRSLEVSETTFVRPPRVLSTTENIRKAIVNGKVFYDATIREQRDIFSNSSRKTVREAREREQRDLFSNSTRKSRNFRLEDSRAPSVITNNNFGKKKVIKPRNVNPVKRVRRVYRKRYNPEEVRKRLLERERSKQESNVEMSRKN